MGSVVLRKSKSSERCRRSCWDILSLLFRKLFQVISMNRTKPHFLLLIELSFILCVCIFLLLEETCSFFLILWVNSSRTITLSVSPFTVLSKESFLYYAKHSSSFQSSIFLPSHNRTVTLAKENMYMTI